MGNTPSKDDPLPKSLLTNLNTSQASAGATDSGDFEPDEDSSTLSHLGGVINEKIQLSAVSVACEGYEEADSNYKLKEKGNNNAIDQSKKKDAIGRESMGNSNLDLDMEIDVSMARLLSNGVEARKPLSQLAPDLSSSCDSVKSDLSIVSPIFTTNGDPKDQDLIPSFGSCSPGLNAQKSINLDTIKEWSLVSTPETTKHYSPQVISKRLASVGSSYLSTKGPLPKHSSSISDKSEINVDNIIRTLVDFGLKKQNNGGHSSQKDRGHLPVTIQEIKYILHKSRSIFLSQPTFLRLSPPVKIVGDIHGQFFDLIRIFNSCGFPPHSNYLFLGDYVDRGHKSLETILLLLCYKIRYPENFFMLRGNHECANITKIYGFYDECKRRLPRSVGGNKLWKSFIDVFNTLPIAAMISDKIFCIHGGLSPDLQDLKQIETIKRPTDIPDTGLLADLLWSDPDPLIRSFSLTNWPKNDRGVSYCFGKKHVDYFCAKFNIELIVRGHMVVEDGYEFFDKRKLITVFLAPNYCGEFNNYGAVMSVDKSLCCSFELIRPLRD